MLNQFYIIINEYKITHFHKRKWAPSLVTMEINDAMRPANYLIMHINLKGNEFFHVFFTMPLGKSIKRLSIFTLTVKCHGGCLCICKTYLGGFVFIDIQCIMQSPFTSCEINQASYYPLVNIHIVLGKSGGPVGGMLHTNLWTKSIIQMHVAVQLL